MRVKFYGLTKEAAAKVENLCEKEKVDIIAEHDDFDGLVNIEINQFEKYIITVSLIKDDIVVHGMESRTHFNISEVERMSVI